MHAVLGLSIKWRGHIEEASVILTIAASVVLQWLASSNQPERWRCAVAHFLCAESDLRIRAVSVAPDAARICAVRAYATGPVAKVASQAYPSLAEHLPPTQFTLAMDETGRAFG